MAKVSHSVGRASNVVDFPCRRRARSSTRSDTDPRPPNLETPDGKSWSSSGERSASCELGLAGWADGTGNRRKNQTGTILRRRRQALHGAGGAMNCHRLANGVAFVENRCVWASDGCWRAVHGTHSGRKRRIESRSVVVGQVQRRAAWESP